MDVQCWLFIALVLPSQCAPPPPHQVEEQDNSIGQAPIRDFQLTHSSQLHNSINALDNWNDLLPSPDMDVTSATDHNNAAAPKYMLELYDKFEKERYAHPVSNIVRSFKSVGKC